MSDATVPGTTPAMVELLRDIDDGVYVPMGFNLARNISAFLARLSTPGDAS